MDIEYHLELVRNKTPVRTYWNKWCQVGQHIIATTHIYYIFMILIMYFTEVTLNYNIP